LSLVALPEADPPVVLVLEDLVRFEGGGSAPATCAPDQEPGGEGDDEHERGARLDDPRRPDPVGVFDELLHGHGRSIGDVEGSSRSYVDQPSADSTSAA
jgi:hypothetical protein